jgi:hypothetical protein
MKKKKITIKKQTLQRKEKARMRGEEKVDTERKIMRLRLQGIQISTIAEAMGISTRMVEKHISDAKKKQTEWFNSQLNKFDLVGFWNRRIQAQEQILEGLWTFYNEADVRDRASVSAKLMDAHEELENIYRKAGVKVTDKTLEDDGIQGVQIIFKNSNGNKNPFEERTKLLIARRKNKIEDENEEEED